MMTKQTSIRRLNTELKEQNAKLLAENKYLKKTWANSSFFGLIKHAVTVVGVCFVAKCIFVDCIAALAGKTTLTNIMISFLGNVAVSQTAAWLLAGGSATWAYTERQLRKRSLTKMSEEKKELEKLLDDQRSSSNLTESGDTNPEDEDQEP